MAYPTPLDPEAREAQRRDPDGYEAVERLHDAYEQLVDALDGHVRVIGVMFMVMHEPARSYFLTKRPLPTQEHLREAQQQVARGQGRWAAAVGQAEALLRDRQEGGDA
jgi:hypothetical protein